MATTGLNPEQREAVQHNFGPMLILAGAGSGKTTVLVARSGRLISEKIVSPKKLCVLTFTNKAAKELKARVQHKLGSHASEIWAGTFHSFGLFLLRRFYKEVGLPKQFGVMDSTDTHSLVKELVHDFHHHSKSAYDPERLLSLMGSWRESGINRAQKEDEYEEAAEWLLPKYIRRLQTLGALDFDSLILKPIELMKQNAKAKEHIQGLFDQVMVDEFQDTNAMQMRLVQLLSEKHKNLTVVGDDDQSIYAWRGACIRNILDFPKLFDSCKVVRLERNYRSTPDILNLANHVIVQNKDRHPKTLKPEAKNPLAIKPVLLEYEDEAEESESLCGEIHRYKNEGIGFQDIAVLYRSNGQGAFLEAELRKNQIPYAMSGGTAFFDRKETRDILAYLRCSLSPNDIAFRRIVNTPPRGIGETSLEALHDLSQEREVPLHRIAKEWKKYGVEERIGNAFDSLNQKLSQLPSQLLQTPATDQALLDFARQIGYREYLDKTSKDALVSSRRWKYLEIFGQILKKFLENGERSLKSISDFVDHMELRDTLDAQDDKTPKVQLMTLHASKGLEFPIVFLIGVEEDLIPHKTLGSDIAEERRLLYVGITRAKERLILSRCKRRLKLGRPANSIPSRFVVEIPTELLEVRSGARKLAPSQQKEMLSKLLESLR